MTRHNFAKSHGQKKYNTKPKKEITTLSQNTKEISCKKSNACNKVCSQKDKDEVNKIPATTFRYWRGFYLLAHSSLDLSLVDPHDLHSSGHLTHTTFSQFFDFVTNFLKQLRIFINKLNKHILLGFWQVFHLGTY